MGNNSVPKFIFRLSRFPVYRGSVLGRFYCICKLYGSHLQVSWLWLSIFIMWSHPVVLPLNKPHSLSLTQHKLILIQSITLTRTVQVAACIQVIFSYVSTEPTQRAISTKPYFFFLLALQPPLGVVFYSPLAGFSLLAYEVSWSHTTTRHSR